MNLIWINSAKYLEDYRLSLSFSNGEQRVFDAKEFIASHPLFASLKDKQLFSQFQLDGWTISWQDGRLDIAPEYLYETGTPAYPIVLFRAVLPSTQGKAKREK